MTDRHRIPKELPDCYVGEKCPKGRSCSYYSRCRSWATKLRGQGTPIIRTGDVKDGYRICAHCGKRYIPTTKRQKYCNYRCRTNANSMRKYYTMRDTDHERFTEVADRKREVAKKWRDDAKKEGRCTRCGEENDGQEIGVSVCSGCYQTIKSNRRN